MWSPYGRSQHAAGQGHRYLHHSIPQSCKGQWCEAGGPLWQHAQPGVGGGRCSRQMLDTVEAAACAFWEGHAQAASCDSTGRALCLIDAVLRPVQVHADELARSDDLEQLMQALLQQENIVVGVQKRYSEGTLQGKLYCLRHALPMC